MLCAKDNKNAKYHLIVPCIDLFYCFYVGPVLSLAVAPDGDYCFSGGIDATIRCWNMPHSTVDPYDSYGKNKHYIFL